MWGLGGYQQTLGVRQCAGSSTTLRYQQILKVGEIPASYPIFWELGSLSGNSMIAGAWKSGVLPSSQILRELGSLSGNSTAFTRAGKSL